MPVLAVPADSVGILRKNRREENAMIVRILLAAPLAAGLFSFAGNQNPAPQARIKEVQPPNSSFGPCPQGGTSMLVDLDGSFTVVTMDGPASGCSGQASGSDVCQRNDDDYTLAVPLSFSFDLFGTTYNSVFINNNGNLSFDNGYCTFTASGFPVSGFPMVAPFWADVDTRNTTSGTVYYRSEANRFTVIWDHVGYYNAHADKLSTFEVIITDGTDPLIGFGNNVAFCYDDMQWTTGDASGGSGGFGGEPATVGVNKGDGTNFFQIGRFGIAGSAYDGPAGSTDGVDYLDETCYTFNVSTTNNNVAPIYLDPPTQCLQAKVGQTLNFTIQAIGPENNQTVTLTLDAHGLANFSSVETPGNPASSAGTFTPDCSQVGQHTIDYTATDDFNPPGVTLLSICIDVTLSPPEEFCFGDTPAECPCGNVGAPTNGCGNSAFAGGAHLGVTGDPCLLADTIAFSATDIRPSTLAMLFQGTTENQHPVSDGSLCVAGNIKRLWRWKNQFSSTLTAPGTATTIPDSTGVTVSQRSQELGDTLSSGSTRVYQIWYRDPTSFGCAPPATSNYTNGIRIPWVQ